MGSAPKKQIVTGHKDPLWYKDAIIYEVHVRAFMDSNGDGIGDFEGLTQKLDYLQELGVTAIWLLPFYPSPLKDDGYDIADYYSINPIYGSLRDFKSFMAEAHRRNLRVITELVVNHTSDQHPWFQRSRRAEPGSKWRDFYVWSESPEKYKDARIIFRDFEPSNWTWDPVAKSYFWHRFYSHQPDLNYDSPVVHREVAKALDFWFDMGVDGLRLDAVPYLYEREGTSCENLPETHQYLKTLRKHMDVKYGDRMLLAEANQWPEDAVSYFGGGAGDECHMAFHFPLMPRIFMAVRMEDRVPIVDILNQTPAIPETSQWALFLRNHDELTLEMVTDEERDYMYRVYANDAKARINLGIRRRLAPLLGGDRKRIELLHLLLFSFPGTPVLYYGDEIGMGDNIFLGDRNGVRTPMQWSSDRNAGFSRANPHALYLPIIQDPEYHFETINVEAQRQNPNSLWWWMKRVLSLRKMHKAFGQGSIKFLEPENRKILAFVRQYEDETILVVANLSRFPQPTTLDLSEFQDMKLMELFGQTEFPQITAEPYFLTLSPHATFWFALTPVAVTGGNGMDRGNLSLVRSPVTWDELWRGRGGQAVSAESVLINYLTSRRWFSGKTRQIKTLHVREAIPMGAKLPRFYLLLISSEYVEGDPEEYWLPVAYATGEEAERIEKQEPKFVISRIEHGNEQGIIYEAVESKTFCEALLESIARKRSTPGFEGNLKSIPGATFSLNGGLSKMPASVHKAEQSNTSITFGEHYFLKLFRRIEPGTNPDLEVGRFLTKHHFPNSPAVAGAIEYHRNNGEKITLGILADYLLGARDSWEYTLDALSRFFERVRTRPDLRAGAPATGTIFEIAEGEAPADIVQLMGTYRESARLLGQRTGELHTALAADPDDKDFAPESFTPFYQRSLYQSMRNLAVQNLGLLRRNIGSLKGEARINAEAVVGLEHEIVARLRAIYTVPLSSRRIRCHGDFHLGQVLYTGKDFIFIDFEGEPARPLGERRIKKSPIRDVAGMIRSFDYVTHTALEKQVELGNLQKEDIGLFEPWGRFWSRWVSAFYFNAYREAIGKAGLLPQAHDQLKVLLDAHLLEKAIYEVGYELNNRPKWVNIPLQGILQILDQESMSVGPAQKQEAKEVVA